MKINKKTFWNLFILFEIIFIIKAISAFMIEGPYILPDEPCLIQRAIYFAQHLKFESCSDITLIRGGDPRPLLSILISPIYLFTHGIKAYHLALTLNALLVSSLVFPLYSIFKKFINKNSIIFAGITVILFLSQVVVFEKTLMTETLFFVINIWFLYFYIHSFEKPHKIRNKIIAILLSILAVFTRPFGFITPLALAINEFIRSKRKKLPLLLLFFAIIAIIYTFITIPSAMESIFKKFSSLSSPENWLLILKALINQLNSFTIATFFIPIIIFFTYIGEKKPKYLKNIRWFLLSFIILNFLISAQHIYGYLLKDKDPNLLTRYINTSIILIYTFAIIFFFRFKKFKFNKKALITTVILITSLFFFEDKGVKHTLNIDLSIYHYSKLHLFNQDIIESYKFLGTYFIPIILILLIFLITNKRKMLTILATITILSYSLLTNIWATNYVIKNPYVDYFQDKEVSISFILENARGTTLRNMWLLFALTKNNLNLILLEYEGPLPPDFKIRPRLFNESPSFKKADYIISPYDSDMPIIFKANQMKLYKNTHKEIFDQQQE